MDIGTEELSHLEVIGTLARMHLKPMKTARDAAEADPLIAIAAAAASTCATRMGNPWTADYLKITGELDVDLRSNIAAEARAKIVYERLIDFTDDAGSQGRAAVPDDARDHAHEGVHGGAGEAGQGAARDRQAPADRGLVDQYFNDSTGQGQNGEFDMSTEWAKKHGFELVDNPAFNPDKMKLGGKAHARR